MTINKKAMGMLIKEARKVKSQKIDEKYTQIMLAKDVGISRSYLGDIEAGRTAPPDLLLGKIATACEVSLSYFDETEAKNVAERNVNDGGSKSFAGKLIDMLLEQDYFDDADDISEETVEMIKKALKKDIERVKSNKEKEGTC